MLTILSDNLSISNNYLREIRDQKLQLNKQKFKHNLELLGMIAGYELSKRLDYKKHSTKTQLGVHKSFILKDKVVLCSILRAGLPLQNGLQRAFENAELAFVGAGRKHTASPEVEIDLSYVASGKLTGKTLIIADTMLATGKSIVNAYTALTSKHGKPDKTYVVSVVASKDGAAYVSKHLPKADLMIFAVDPKLNDKFYIVPGLGDAGDLLYGSKL